ncbi:tumor necrosis factor receptor superfamily member 26-like isoform X2 [Cavia porcellus]|uniref:tumor necrosis factor receptor superfamily member 26-like isoform X2 n=1 Tax=Cavia porcellus TaxID=10141 RepID=UPI002FDF6AE3
MVITAQLLLLLTLQVTVVSSVTPCKPQKCCTDDLCHPCCPAGCYVSKTYMGNQHTIACAPCDPGTFMKIPNTMQSCFSCSKCRNDQEVVSKCSSTADQQCQCKTGYYCDTENCVERCFRCSREQKLANDDCMHSTSPGFICFLRKHGF